MSRARYATQIIEHAKTVLKLTSAPPSSPDEERQVSERISDSLIEIIGIASKMDARTGTVDPSRKRVRKPAAP